MRAVERYDRASDQIVGKLLRLARGRGDNADDLILRTVGRFTSQRLRILGRTIRKEEGIE